MAGTRRWERRALRGGLGLAVVLALVGGAELTRGWAQARAHEAIQQAAARRGWTVGWESLRLGYDLSLTIEGLEAHGAAGSRVTLARLEAGWSPSELLQGQRAPHDVVLSGLGGDIDVMALRAARSSQAVAGQEATGRLGLGLSRVQLDEGSLTLRGLPGMAPVTWGGLSLDGAPGDEGAWRGALKARCEEGCGPVREVTGAVHGQDGAWKAGVELDAPFPLRVPAPAGASPVELSVRRVHLELGPEGLRVALGEVQAPLAAGPWEGRVEVAEMEAELEGGSLSRAVLTRPTIHLRRRPSTPGAQVASDTPDTSDEARPARRRRGKRAARREAARREAALREAALLAHRARRQEVSDTSAHLDGALAMIEAVATEHLGHLSRIEIQGGRLLLEGGPTLEDLSARGDARRYEVKARLGEASLSVELRSEAPHVEVGIEGLRLAAAVGLWPKLGEALGKLRPLRRVDGTLSGRASLARATAPGGARGLAMEGRFSLEGGALDVDGLTEAPIEGQRASLELASAWWPPTEGAPDRVEIGSLALKLPSRQGGAEATVRFEGKALGAVTGGLPPRIEARLWMEQTPCAVAVGAIPRALMGPLADEIVLEGDFAPEVSFAVDMADPEALDFEVKGLPGRCQLVDLGQRSPDYLRRRFRQEVTEGVSHAGIYVGPSSGAYVPLEEVPLHTREAMIVTEDGRFYEHGGFDLIRLKAAIGLNLSRGRYVYGGSTITQQLAKNLLLTRRKTLGRKLEEAFIAWRMEEVLGKERILELYVNCIEFGPDIYGIVRAAEHYFGKKPSELTVLEGAFLAALKPAPLTGGSFYDKGHTSPTGWWHKRMQGVVGRMARRGALTQAQATALDPYVVTFRSWSGAPPAREGAIPGTTPALLLPELDTPPLVAPAPLELPSGPGLDGL